MISMFWDLPNQTSHIGTGFQRTIVHSCNLDQKYDVIVVKLDPLFHLPPKLDKAEYANYRIMQMLPQLDYLWIRWTENW